MILQREFYQKSAPQLAPLLLGKLLCRRTEDGVIRLRITETEAYFGEEDSACHASRGKTSRTQILYHSGGVAYIYLCYGIHHLLNIVSGEEGHPEAVLIRGADGYNGPGKLTRALCLDRSHNGISVTDPNGLLWLEDDDFPFEYETSPRIGIDYAKETDRMRHWRFVVR